MFVLAASDVSFLIAAAVVFLGPCRQRLFGGGRLFSAIFCRRFLTLLGWWSFLNVYHIYMEQGDIPKFQ